MDEADPVLEQEVVHHVACAVLSSLSAVVSAWTRYHDNPCCVQQVSVHVCHGENQQLPEQVPGEKAEVEELERISCSLEPWFLRYSICSLLMPLV